MDHRAGVWVLIGLLALAPWVLWQLWRRRTFSEAAFRDAPLRSLPLGPADLIIGLGLMLLGLSAAATVMRRVLWPDGQVIPIADMDARQTLTLMLINHAAQLPAVLYTVIRLWQGGATPPRMSRARAALAGVGTLVVTIPLLLLTTAIVMGIVRAMGAEPPTIAHDILKLLSQEPWSSIKLGLIVSAVVIAPLMEETLFRGLLQTSAVAAMPRRRWWAILATSVVFTLIHAGVAQWHAWPLLFVLSLGLGYIYERTGTLAAPIVMHATFNAMQVTAVLLGAGAGGT